MSTSEHQGFILYDPTDLATDEPMDTVLVRDVINNANHLADEAAQVRFSWIATGAGLNAGADANEGEWFDFRVRGTFDAKVRSDGTGYRLRVWIAGASNSFLSEGESIDFVVAIGPAGISAEDIGAPFVVTATATNALAPGIGAMTPIWLTLDSGLTYVDVPATVIAEAQARTAPTATLTDIGGAPATVQTVRLEIIVCGRTNSGLTDAVLYGVHVAEYIGG